MRPTFDRRLWILLFWYFILKSKKKGLIGDKLYTENDGCLIDEDEILELLWETPLLLLQEGEKWEALPTPSTSQEILNESSSFIFTQSNSMNNIVPSDDSCLQIHSLSDTSIGTTLSMTSGVLSETGSQGSIGLEQTTLKFQHFQIPWSKIPQNILKLCENGEQLGPHLKTVIHIIINELRTISYYIPVSVIREVVGKMTSKYPKTFLCTDTSGQTISISHSPLITSFIQRNNYLNRPNITKRQSLNIPLKKKRLSKNFEGTCINWQPKLSEEKENLDELAAKQLFLIDMSKHKTLSKEDFNKISITMKDSYVEIRNYLNALDKIPSVKNIKDDWPFLLKYPILLDHYHELTENDPRNVLQCYAIKNKRLLDFFERSKPKIATQTYKNYSDDYQRTLRAVCTYFKENEEYIFKNYQIGTTLEEVVQPGTHPWIAVVGIPPTDQQITSQKVSGQKIQELADRRESANIRILPECANCTSSSSSRSSSSSSAGASRFGDRDQERQNQRSAKNKQKAHQQHHRHQANKFHDGQQVNNGELPGNHKANVQHEDDSLKKPAGAYRHGSQRHSLAPPQLPSPPRPAGVDSSALTTNAPNGRVSGIRSPSDNDLRLSGWWQAESKNTADAAAAFGSAEFIDSSRESDSGYTDSASQSHFLAGIFHKFPTTSILGKTRKISSDSSSGYFTYANADTDADAVSTELHGNDIGNPDVESGFSGEAGKEVDVVAHRVKRATSESGSDPASDDPARNREQLNNAISSSDISKSDIRYNETLSPNLNPPSTSSSGGAAALSEQFVPQLPSPLPKTDVSNLSFSGSVDKHISDAKVRSSEPIIIIDDGEEFDSGISSVGDSRSLEEYAHDEPRVLPLRPVIRGPSDNTEHGNEMSVVYAEQHTEIKLVCEVDIDIATNVWLKNGQIVHAMDRTSRVADYRFIKEPLGGLTITNVMLEDDGKWQCEAENSRGYVETARPVKLVVLDRPKPPYLLIDSRRLDAGNIFVPVKENSELSLACVSEGGNPKPTLTWEVLLSPGVDRHAQKVAAEVLELEEIKSEKEEPYKINSGAKSEARLPAVYRAHHNARILCVMEHPTLKMRQNASLLLDVQYTPSFAISRTPGFGYPLREGIEVSLKCDVDSNPPSTPRWQKDDGDTPVPQTGDGFLNFTSIRREHSGWYKCTSRHLNFQYSSIGYYLSVRYDSVDVTSEPDDQEVSVAASHNPNKGQLEVQLGGAVTLQCPQGSLGCWSHLDPVTARLRGLGAGISTPTGQFSLKDVVYQDAGTYKCIGQSPSNKKKLEVLQTVGVLVKGAPTAVARNATPVAYPGSPLHLTVEFCANPPAYAARWLHGDRVYTPGNQYGSTVLAYGVTDLPTPFCKEARLTYVSMHERVPRTFYFIVSSPGGVAEAIFKVNFTLRYRTMSNSIDEEEEELSEPEEIHFPVFGNGALPPLLRWTLFSLQLLLLYTINTFMYVLL